MTVANTLTLNFNIFNSLILAGIIQGFVFALIWLFNKKYRAKSTYYLIALIGIYSLSNLQYYLLDIGLFDPALFYDLYQVPLSLCMPPLLLLYGLTLLSKNTFATRKPWLLFLPFAITMCLALYYKYQLLINKEESGYSIFLDQIPSWSEYIAIVYSLAVLIYLLFVIRVYRKSKSFSITELKPRVKWFKTLVIVQLCSTVLWVASELAFGDSYETSYYYPLWIVLAIVIYWLGHTGIYKYGVLEERKKLRKEKRSSFSVMEVRNQKNTTIEALDHFVVAQKNYLDPQLTLEKTAQELNLSTGHLSKLINTKLQQSFKDYLNSLRVEEAKSYLQNPDFSHYTLVAIGLEAGFNSKSAFNASFKKVTGLTPSQFKSQTRN